MLLEPVLHHLRAVPNEPQMRVDLLHHGPRAMAELAAHGEGAHGCPSVECLQPRRAVRVPEHAAPNLPLLPSGSCCHPVQGLTPLHEHRLSARQKRWKEEACWWPAEDVGPEDLFELGPERDHA